MRGLTDQQWIQALVATSPLRFLLRDEVALWIAWDSKSVNISGIQVGVVVWSRLALVEGTRKSGWTVMRDYFGAFWSHKVKEPPLMDYSVCDILGQEWLGRGYPGQVGRFHKCKEI